MLGRRRLRWWIGGGLWRREGGGVRGSCVLGFFNVEVTRAVRVMTAGDEKLLALDAD